MSSNLTPGTSFLAYKLVNIAESVGTVTQDRLAGIAGELGVGPDTSQ